MTTNNPMTSPTTQSPWTRGPLLTCPTKPTESAANASESVTQSAGKTPTCAEPVSNKPLYLIDGLSMLEARLGYPAWYWPAVLGVLFGGLPLLASYLEHA